MIGERIWIAAKALRDAVCLVNRRCAESIYQENGFKNSTASSVWGRIESPGHRKSMLDPGLHKTWIDAAFQSDGTLCMAQIFMKRFIVIQAKTTKSIMI
jgi:hypothetical protein